MPGTRALTDFVLAATDHLAFNGIYNCRPPRGAASGFSAHAEGRAFDLNAALPTGKPNPAPVPRGSPADLELRYWMELMVANAEGLGVQRAVYQEREWRCGRGWFTPSHGLQVMHANHLHTEQNRQRANTLTTAQIVAVLEEDWMAQLTEAEKQRLLAGADAAVALEKRWDTTARTKLDDVWVQVIDRNSEETVGGMLEALVDGTKPEVPEEPTKVEGS
jgi:hypothetical protein